MGHIKLRNFCNATTFFYSYWYNLHTCTFHIPVFNPRGKFQKLGSLGAGQITITAEYFISVLATKILPRVKCSKTGLHQKPRLAWSWSLPSPQQWEIHYYCLQPVIFCDSVQNRLTHLWSLLTFLGQHLYAAGNWIQSTLTTLKCCIKHQVWVPFSSDTKQVV